MLLPRSKYLSSTPTTFVIIVVIVVVVNASVSDNPSLNSVFTDALDEVSIAQLIPASLTTSYGLNASCFNDTDGYSSLKQCLSSQCASRSDVARLYKTATSSLLLPRDVSTVAPGVLYVLTQIYTKTHCLPSPHQAPPKPPREGPTPAAVWGYSFAFVTVINLCSLLGMVLSACTKLRFYNLILIFMVAIAVGTLVGSGLLVLIPEALELGVHGDHSYIWKICAVMSGVYLFFIIERVMRMINTYRERLKEEREKDEEATQDAPIASFHIHASHNPHLTDPIPGSPALVSFRNHQHHNDHHHHHQHNSDDAHNKEQAFDNATFVNDDDCHKSPSATTASSSPSADQAVCKAKNGLHSKTLGEETKQEKKQHKHGHSHGSDGVAPVAYMIVFGDAMHNFIDGLSIGAAFSESTLLGVSVAVAVLCEELPHELGDFAILLNSGLSAKRALLYNFLSSVSCYVGLVIGIVLGETTTANTWIFAIAGGMFLYISLTDMLPEMNSAAESEDAKQFGQVKIFLLQNIGLILGYGLILILVIYGGEINFDGEE